MTDNFVVFVEGVADANLTTLLDSIRSSARMAINKSAKRGRTRSAAEMMRQVNFPKSYLRGENSRLSVTKLASNDDLEAVISGRKRPTSLARFVTGTTKEGGVTFMVKPGRTGEIKKAFIFNLRQGDGSGAMANKGLAVRTSGGRPRGAYHPTRLGDNLWLLYGPSVDQVFKTVREDVGSELEVYLRDEFLRLLEI